MQGLIAPDTRHALDVAAVDFEMEIVYDELRRVVGELSSRRIEALEIYEPLPNQEPFHKCDSQQRIVIGSNRSGKTISAAAEVARAACGRDPYNKYPLKDGRIALVGKSVEHCGDVMYRKLFRAGAYKIIRDEATGEWRPFHVNEPADAARKHLAKPAPPLIPRRFIKPGGISWLDKRAMTPKVVTLVNGWELRFFSGQGEPPQGTDLDLIWMDEEIPDPRWLPEMQARILDREGKIIWSATAQIGTEHLFELHERAQREALDMVKPTVVEFQLLIVDNEYMSE